MLVVDGAVDESVGTLDAPSSKLSLPMDDPTIFNINLLSRVFSRKL